jgi:poly(3-hydroxybutyrate) depolymerase
MVPSFHGKGKDKDYQAKLSRFTNPAIHPNMFVVFQRGLSPSGENYACWPGPDYCQTDASDKVFTSDVVNSMRVNYCIEDTKICPPGKSIGGGFVDILACSLDKGRHFAAFAIDATTLYTEMATDVYKGFHPPRPRLPALELQGTDGTVAAYYNGHSHDQELSDIPDVLRKWAVRKNYGSTPVPTIDQVGRQGYLLHPV